MQMLKTAGYYLDKKKNPYKMNTPKPNLKLQNPNKYKTKLRINHFKTKHLNLI